MRPSRDLLSLAPHVLMAGVFALGVYNGAETFVRTSAALRMRADEGLFIGLLAFQLSSMYFPVILKK